MEPLKDEMLELLEKDREFRYAVAGYLGLSEIMKRLDAIAEEQVSLRKEQIRFREEQTRIWKELSELRKGQNKLWENQEKLWKSQERLLESQERLWKSQGRLLENQERLWEEVRELRLEQGRMRKYMLSGFRSLSRALGVTFEDHSASFLEVMLGEMGYPEARVEKKYLIHKGEIVELNLFCEKPLVVGEATVNIGSVEEAEREVEKLMSRVRIVEERYGRSPLMTILSVARSTPQASEALRSLAEKHKIKLIMGGEIEESIST